MFFRSILLTSTALGLLGVGLAFLQLRRSRLIFWLMVGSGVSLCVPLGHHLLVQLLSNLNLFGGYGVLRSTYGPVAAFHAWMQWPAYALLFFGVLDLRMDRSEPALAGATLSAHPSVASDADGEAGLGSMPPGPPASHPDVGVAGINPSSRPHPPPTPR